MVHLDRWATEQAFSAEESEDPALDPGPVVSVRSLKHALRRRRRLWLTMAFAGLFLGAALHMVLPSKVTAVSKLYLVESISGDPTSAITNDLSLLETHKVAETAMGMLHLGPNHALISYKGSSQGSSILSISVTAPTAATAVAWNNAVAHAFLQVRAQLQGATTKSDVQALQAEIQSLQSDLQRISNGSSSPLVNIDETQINTLNHEIYQAQGSLASITSNSLVLDSAYVPHKSIKKVAIKDGLTGLVGGLALGASIVILGELLSDRVRTRADVASALGAPVDLSVGRLS
jgi:uncharacterized protein involved in exopolysaccharide biosynthesis